MKQTLLKLFCLYLTVVAIASCLSFKSNQQQQLEQVKQKYQHPKDVRFQSLEIIQKNILASKNMTFQSIHEKYLFIYHDLINDCVQNIGQDFQPFLNSLMPAGISAATIGVATGAKLLLTAGLWKTGLFLFFKTAAITAFSTATLPITIGVGSIAYAYNKYSEYEVKQRCQAIVKQVQQKIAEQQLQDLMKIKSIYSQILQQIPLKLKGVQSGQVQMQKFFLKYKNTTDYLISKYDILKQYFKVYGKLYQRV